MIDDGVIGDRALAFLIGLDALAAANAGALRQREIDAALAQLRQSNRDRPIDLSGGLVAKRPGEERRSGGIAGDQQDARRVLVETVHQAWPLAALEAQPVEQRIDMPIGVGAALHGEPRRPVYDDGP